MSGDKPCPMRLAFVGDIQTRFSVSDRFDRAGVFCSMHYGRCQLAPSSGSQIDWSENALFYVRITQQGSYFRAAAFAELRLN